MADFKTFDGYKLKDVQGRETLGEIEAYIGYPDDNVLGLAADFENSTFTRLAAAKGLNAGSDFNAFKMYGDRKLCNLADDGTITAWYGDPNYTETGYTTIVDPDTQEESTIQVQVMVRQPKFYYKVVPIKLEPITSTDPTQTGVHGYSGVKMNYYISDKPLPGFKLHPAFINANGDEVDCYYIGAYKACLYDASESEYRLYDTWDVTYDAQRNKYTVNALDSYLADKDNDRLSSIPGPKPASGDYSNDFISTNIDAMAKNRGMRWGSLNIKMVSAEQILMLIEYAAFNMQNALGWGVCEYASASRNCSAFVGTTNFIGNGSGSATTTKQLKNTGVLGTYTTRGWVSIRYRGVEDLWGNIRTHINGINIYGDGTMDGGEAYICDDFNFEESKSSGNYKPVNFTLPSSGGGNYIKYFGYYNMFDWIFLPTVIGKGAYSTVPVGDTMVSTSKNDGYKIVEYGGYWASSYQTGAFYWNFTYTVGSNSSSCGARLCYV